MPTRTDRSSKSWKGASVVVTWCSVPKGDSLAAYAIVGDAAAVVVLGLVADHRPHLFQPRDAGQQRVGNGGQPVDQRLLLRAQILAAVDALHRLRRQRDTTDL
jgi:hypothetical protein